MAFLHENPDKIELGKSERTVDAQAKLAAFRAKVEKLKHVKYWTNADTLQGRVAMSFASFTKMYPTVGWIRGDVETAAGALAEINQLRKQLERAQQQLASVRSSPPPGTEGLAQGDDRFEIEIVGRTEVRGESGPYGPEYTTWSGPEGINPTWDELFSALGPDSP